MQGGVRVLLGCISVAHRLKGKSTPLNSTQRLETCCVFGRLRYLGARRQRKHHLWLGSLTYEVEGPSDWPPHSVDRRAEEPASQRRKPKEPEDGLFKTWFQTFPSFCHQGPRKALCHQGPRPFDHSSTQHNPEAVSEEGTEAEPANSKVWLTS